MIGPFLILFFTLSFSYAKELLLASTYPIYYPLKYIAGDRFEVDVLIKTQADPHHYELKPSDMRRLQSAKAFFYLGVEGWEKRVARSLPKGKAYPLERGINFIKIGNSPDPHLWLSPRAYAQLVENISKALISMDPLGAEKYKERSEEFLRGLKALDEDYKKTLSNCQSKVVVITHLSTLYLGRDYGLEVVGLRGLHAEEEPKPSEIRMMVERVRRAKVRTLFHELGYDEALAKRIAQEVGAKIIPFNTSLFPERAQDDYFSVMKRNLERLSEGLNCPTR
ncbi:MAG: metal ABC transporter substrate-binding protein [Aquificaceae bacterium]